MSIITRLTTWVSSQVLTASALNGEFNNIVNLINNLDAGTTPWTNVKPTNLLGNITTTGNITFSPSTKGLVGTATNDSATTGNVGEYITGTDAASYTNVATSTQYKDFQSIALTAGDWDVMGRVRIIANGGTISGACGFFIGTVAGNNITGLSDADNYADFNNGAFTSISLSVDQYRVSISSNTTYYIKGFATYSAGTPQFNTRISARRVR